MWKQDSLIGGLEGWFLMMLTMTMTTVRMRLLQPLNWAEAARPKNPLKPGVLMFVWNISATGRARVNAQDTAVTSFVMQPDGREWIQRDCSLLQTSADNQFNCAAQSTGRAPFHKSPELQATTPSLHFEGECAQNATGHPAEYIASIVPGNTVRTWSGAQ